MRQEMPLQTYPLRYSDNQNWPKSSNSNNYFSAKSDYPNNARGHDTKTGNRMQGQDLPVHHFNVGGQRRR